MLLAISFPFLVTFNLNYCLSVFAPDASINPRTGVVSIQSITGNGMCAGVGLTPKSQFRNIIREELDRHDTPVMLPVEGE